MQIDYRPIAEHSASRSSIACDDGDSGLHQEFFEDLECTAGRSCDCIAVVASCDNAYEVGYEISDLLTASDP